MTSAPPPSLEPLAEAWRRGRPDEMERLARALLRGHPTLGAAWKALGVALLLQGRDARDALGRALQLLPEDAELAVQLGSALNQRGEHEAAQRHFQQALRLEPARVDARINLGLALLGLGRLQEAEACLREALARAPDAVPAWSNLGLCLRLQGRPDEAIEALAAALARDPALLPARRQLGLCALALGRHALAREALEACLAHDPDNPWLLNDLGSALQGLGRVDEAGDCYQRARALAPRAPQPRANLALLARERGDWPAADALLAEACALAPQDLSLLSDRLFVRGYAGAAALPDTLALAREFGARARARARPGPPDARLDGDRRPLRVGLLSPDLREHPVGHFLESVLQALRASSELVLLAYSHAAREDALSEQLRGCCEHWRRVRGLDDAALADTIRADRVDVLIDLAGHTAGNRLPVLAWRPAPVQLCWLGWCASTGMAEVDHLLVDPWIAPPGAEAQCVEPLWRLPESFLCFSPPADAPPVAPLPALREGVLTLGCFNKRAKLGDQLLVQWARLLRALPHARLLLKNAQVDVPAHREALRDRCAAAGLPMARVVLEGASPRADYLARHAAVDIALDPFPYPGGTTSMEALWMGVPVLTRGDGHSLLSRQGLSLMRNAGLADWVARDPDHALELACAHAADLPRLAALRAGLRERVRASPLCDAPRFAAHLEAALRDIWQRHRRGGVAG